MNPIQLLIQLIQIIIFHLELRNLIKENIIFDYIDLLIIF